MTKSLTPTDNHLVTASSDDLLVKLQRYMSYAQGAYATNTELAKANDWRLFVDWCEKQVTSPLPASPETLAAFIDAMAQRHAVASIRRYVSTVSTAHRAVNVSNPCDSEIVKLALKRAARKNGVKQNQAAPVNWAHIESALATLGDGLLDCRDKALLCVGYDALLRRSEIAAILIEHITFHEDGTGTLFIPKSKSDQYGEGAERPLAKLTITYVRAWIKRAGIDSGALLRGIGRGCHIKNPLSTGGVGRAIQRVMKTIGHTDNVSGHSLRVGMTQDLTAAGVSLPAIMQSGGWKSPRMPARYASQLHSQRGAVAQLAKKQGRS